MASPDPRVVRKTGEGMDRPNAEAELPIDINYQKLTEWLVTRQKLPVDWHARLQAIQARSAQAAKELPPGLLASLPGADGTAVDYFRARAVRDKLAQDGERSLFGGLTGQAGVWDKIVRAYENGGVFVAEAAQGMVQNVDYEVPYLRKQMAKCTQQLADADRRHAEYTRSAASCAANYRKECERLGIAGVDVARELRSLTAQLPDIFDALVVELRLPELEDALQYYQAFTDYAHGNKPELTAANTMAAAGQTSSSSSSGSQGGAAPPAAAAQQPPVLCVLREVREGTTAPPDAGVLGAGADAVNNAAAAGGGEAGSIDWGLDLLDSAQGPDAGGQTLTTGISWDLGGGDGGSGGGISWDVEVEQQQPAATAAAGEEGAAAGAAADALPSLDWDIDVSSLGIDMQEEGVAGEGGAHASGSVDPAGAASAGHCSGIELSGAGGGGGDGGGSSSADVAAARLQGDAEYRALLLDDLQELRAFLIARRTGMASSGSGSELLRALAPEAISSTDAAAVGRMLAAVEKALASLQGERLRQLLLLATSSRYVARLASSLHRRAGQEAKMMAAAAETQARKQEARSTLAGLQPKLLDVVSQTRVVKAEVESTLSRQFGGRRVNVLGEINNALAAGQGA